MNVSMEHGRKGFYQWDTGQRLIVDDDGACREVHFAHSYADLALVCSIREENGVRVVDVPNILLQEDGKLWAYLYYYAENGALTRHANSFDVSARPKPDSYVYTETETLNYTYLDARIKAMEATGADPEAIASGVKKYLSENPITPDGIGALPADVLPEAINEALAQAKESGEFDGYTPVKGTDYFTDADKQEIAEQAAALVEIPDVGSVGGSYCEVHILTEDVASYTMPLETTQYGHYDIWVSCADSISVTPTAKIICNKKILGIVGYSAVLNYFSLTFENAPTGIMYMATLVRKSNAAQTAYYNFVDSNNSWSATAEENGLVITADNLPAGTKITVRCW